MQRSDGNRGRPVEKSNINTRQNNAAQSGNSINRSYTMKTDQKCEGLIHKENGESVSADSFSNSLNLTHIMKPDQICESLLHNNVGGGVSENVEVDNVLNTLNHTHIMTQNQLCETMLDREIEGETSAAENPSNSEPPNLNGYALAKLYISCKPVIEYMEYLFIPVCGKKGYKPINDKDLQRDIRATMNKDIKPYLNKYLLSEAVEFIHSDFSKKITDEELDKVMHLIAFSNCILNTNTCETFDLSINYPIFTVLNVPYYRNRKPMLSGVWRTFLNHIADNNEEYKKVLRQVLGYLLSSYYCAKVAIFFVGLPNTGKSTLCNLILRLVGKDNISNVPWEKLDQKFYNATIFSKHINEGSEITLTRLRSIGNFKMLTGGDNVLGEEKGGTPFFYKYRGKLLFSGNNPPYTDELDSTDAFFDRLLILPFMNPVSPKEKNTNILDELMEDSDAIIYDALIGLQELRSNNWVFSSSKIVDDYKQEYMKEMNSVRFFVESELDACDNSHKIFMKDLYHEYKHFCHRNCIIPQETSLFRQQIGRYGKLGKVRIGEETLSGIRGLMFKTYSSG